MEDNFTREIDNIKKNFYEKQNKNIFFTSKQKLNLANTVSQSMNLDELINKTVYIIHDTNKVFLDYTMFKLFANPSNYDILVRYIVQLSSECIDKYGFFEAHVNLDSFTVSACHRYKEVIEKFLGECMKHETVFTEKIVVMHIYNIPHFFDTIQRILAPLIHDNVKKKIELHDKLVSSPIITSLLS
jgi:hypothetical protein